MAHKHDPSRMRNANEVQAHLSSPVYSGPVAPGIIAGHGLSPDYSPMMSMQDMLLRLQIHREIHMLEALDESGFVDIRSALFPAA